MTGRMHLRVAGQDPVSEGPYGCDYRWSSAYLAYTCLPHRWAPGSDSSYAWHQGDPYACNEDETQ
jgi:hypothetical protein